METLLFLAHRLPYPPTKGDKVRSHHLLRHLAQRYRVVLGSFIDDPQDWQHVEALRALCAEVHIEPIVRWSRPIRCAEAVLNGEEARLLSAAAPECANRITAIENGVDSEHFSPAHRFESPFPTSEHAIVFTGAMDYWPNMDAVVWFAREVLPRIRQHDASARFHVVGMNPHRTVRALESDAAVNVTGRVDDVRR